MSTEFRSELCVVKGTPGKPVYLSSDNGHVLNPLTELDSTVFKLESRYMVTYIVLESPSGKVSHQVSGDYSVRVIEMQSVLVKPMLLPEEQTPSVRGEDPVKVVSQPWLGGGFLNMELVLKYDNNEIKHSLWMLVDTTLVENGSRNTYLTLLHNANGDKLIKKASTLVSFDCANLDNREESDSLIIDVLEMDANDNPVSKRFRLLNTAKSH